MNSRENAGFVSKGLAKSIWRKQERVETACSQRYNIGIKTNGYDEITASGEDIDDEERSSRTHENRSSTFSRSECSSSTI